MKRWDLEYISDESDRQEMRECDTGDYVLYADVAAAIDEVDALRATVAARDADIAYLQRLNEVTGAREA